MVNDRGNIKWTTMMLPEHQKMLQELWAQDNWKEMPLIDDQMKNEMNQKLQMAVEQDLMIVVEYFKDHDFHQQQGKITHVDSNLRYVRVNDEEIPLNSLIEVSVD